MAVPWVPWSPLSPHVDPMIISFFVPLHDPEIQAEMVRRMEGNSQIGQLRAATGFPISDARTCSSFLARFNLVWVG